MSTVLAVSPHPDDELMGAGATLMALRDAGWRVVNLACGLGRPEDRERRRAELVEACRRARFELVIAEAPTAILTTLEQSDPSLIVGPSPHDNHPAHETIGRALRDAVEARGAPANVMFWGLWGDLPLPNVIVGFGNDRLAELQHALAAHAGELARNGFDRVLAGRAAVSAVLGPELVFGFGAAGREHAYAELLTHTEFTPSGGWRLTAARELDPASPVAAGDGPEVGWWLHARSARQR